MRGLSLLLLLGVFLGVAEAQPAGSAAPAAPSAAGSADPAPPAADPAPPATGSAAPAGDPSELRKICAAAMNTNEGFARSIIKNALETDRVTVKAMCESVDTIKTHQDAVAHVEKNERHVIGAYAAMWVIAALFLLYLHRRQQRLKAEIAQLRHDLDAAAKDGKDSK
jgi:hypothetical protein